MFDVSKYQDRANRGDEDALLIAGLLAALGDAGVDAGERHAPPLQAAAESGNLYAQYVLARFCEPEFSGKRGDTGFKVRQTEVRRVIAAYSALAKDGFVPAQEKLGFFYEVLGDLDNAIMWNGRAADGGNVNAMVSLARIFDGNTGLRPDLEQARYYYSMAEENGYLPAAAEMGWTLLRSNSPEDRAEGWKKLRLAVIEGDALACQYVSWAIVKGHVKDHKTIAQLFMDMSKHRRRHT